MGTYIQHKLNEIFAENDFSDLDTDDPLPDEDKFGGYILTGKIIDPRQFRRPSNRRQISIVYGNLDYNIDPGEPEICVSFDYQPEERGTLEYPGCQAYTEIYTAWLTDTNEEIDIDAASPELLNDLNDMIDTNIDIQNELE